MICNESAHLSPAELTWLISSTWLNMHLINTGCHHWYLLCDYRAWITTIMKHLHTMQSLIENHLLICKILSPPTLWQNNFIKHDIKCLVQIFLNLINCLERESNIQQCEEIILRKLMKYFCRRSKICQVSSSWIQASTHQEDVTSIRRSCQEVQRRQSSIQAIWWVK